MKRSQEAKATRPSRQVNYLTGHSTEDDFSHQEPQDSSSGSDLLEQLAQLLAGGEVKAKGGKKEAAGRKAEDAAFVRRLVAALGGDRTAKDRDWVEANGVPGFAAPDDPRREPLHIGKVCKALGIKVPAKCPKDPSSLVGPECPCGQIRGIGDDNWYYAPGSDEFKSGDTQFTKRPAMGEKFGYYHKLGNAGTTDHYA
ncbi:hypothetical protein AB1Y20_004424 [Prymnesium parvum]|uniref:Uncharacterized protein n=1 Tax=Prymnesium parvum TaxID=97485 RepID=A0AB34IZ41_PRYPA